MGDRSGNAVWPEFTNVNASREQPDVFLPGLLSKDQNPERLSAPTGRSERWVVLVHLLHVTVTFHLHAALACGSAGRGRSYGRDGVFNVDRPGVLEFERGVH